MSKKEILVEYLSNINSVIKQSLHQTQRIKFTSFDVSLNYIVFGATSGGIYVFNRNPCKFIKLIPNKEGSITNIVVSSDEKNIALATIKGFVVVIENCFRDSNIQYQIYAEHEGNHITIMKWYFNDLYCGDCIGQISVISLTQLLTKALFQTPSAILMRLDSSIVQLDIYSHFLLISTKTRTYLCDTLQEQYRQIGKKLRDGNYGACFLYKNNVSNSTTVPNEKKLFKNLKEDERLLVKDTEGVKIYCARPGSRLWEANFDSSVECTHQFRDSLKNNATTIIHLDENIDSSLSLSYFEETAPCNFNFERIFVFSDYILTFKIDGIYIFDIKTVSLLYWTNYFNSIKDVRILGNIIYIWLENNMVKILSLLDIESFIMKVLSCKQYLLCAQFCSLWKDEISVLIDDNKLQILKVLKEKLLDKEISSDIEPLLKRVENNKVVTQKLQNGIYMVDNVHCHENYIMSNNSSNNINENNSAEINDYKNKEEPLAGDNQKVYLHKNNSQLEKNSLINILNKQYQLNKISNNIDIPHFQEIMQTKSLEEFQELFDNFLDYTNGEYASKQWLTSQILRFVSSNVTQYFNDLSFCTKSFQFITECFVFLNASNDLCCCGFPLSSASLKTIHHYTVGCQIIQNYHNYIELCKLVPAMHRFILEKKCEENLVNSLTLLMQYNDIDLFHKYCKKFTYDMWDESLKLLVKLKHNICLNCDKNIKNKLNITWNTFGKCMLYSIGSSSTLKLLLRYSKCISPGELETDFYQFCIFTNCLSSNGNDSKMKSLNFLHAIEEDDKSKTEFDLIILKYLNKKYVGDIKQTNISSYLTDSNCSICDISLKSPLLQDNIKLRCGHFSHNICAITKDECKSCDTDI